MLKLDLPKKNLLELGVLKLDLMSPNLVRQTFLKLSLLTLQLLRLKLPKEQRRKNANTQKQRNFKILL